MERSFFEKVKRKKILISRSFQLRYMAYVMCAVLGASAVVGISFYFGVWDGVINSLADEKVRENLILTKDMPSDNPKESSPEDDVLYVFKNAEKLSKAQKMVVQDIMSKTNGKLMPAMICLIFLGAWISLYLTHRIAGPLYRICKDLEEVNNGNLRTRIALRKFDEGQALAESVNNAVAGFDITVILLKRIMRRYESDPEKMLAHLQMELSKFKTSAE
jgi:methyl-accepting chemotaxis protein